MKWTKQMSDVGLTKDDLVRQSRETTPPQRRLDERRFQAMLLADDRPITRRKVVEAWAWASGGVSARHVDGAIDTFVERPTSLFEHELREVDVISSLRAQRVLGGRPLEERDLKRWLEASQMLERTTPMDYRDRDVERTRSSLSESHGWSR
jgi:hypothetical protein